MRLLPALPLCALLCATTPVAADITAPELYSALEGAARAAGGTLSARDQASPGKLVLREVTFADRDGTRIVFGPVTLTETPDRAVIVTLPERFDLTVLPAPRLAPGAVRQIVFTVAMPGIQARIRGLAAKDAGVEIKAASVSVTLDRVEPALPAGQSLSFALAAADLALVWDQAPRDGIERLTARADLGTGHADLSYLLLDPAKGRSRGEIVFDLAGLTAGMDVALPPELTGPRSPEGRDAAEFLHVLGLGTKVDLSAATRAFALTGSVEEPSGAPDGGPIRFEAQAESSGARLGIDATAIDYASSLGKGRLRITGKIPDQPLDDFGLSWDGYRSSLRVGLGTMVDPQDWSLGLDVLGLALSDQLWALADPKSALPHDPATLIVNLSGKYAADRKALAPGGWQTGEDMPLSALSVALDKVLLSALGVEITADGALDLDFSAVKTPTDPPEPVGSVSMLIKGANALLERLSASGLLSAEELQSLRFGLLFIGRAGAAPDTLETTMEFGKGGSFTLNGQRIK